MSNEPTSCGCSGDCAAVPEPIVCTLAGRQQQEERAAEFRRVFLHLRSTEFLGGSFRWHFQGGATLESQLQALAIRENECCRFFEFEIAPVGDAIVWETRAPESARAVLEEFMRLPETLSLAPDGDALKRALTAAGLEFAGESE